jgi:hypothetical protein
MFVIFSQSDSKSDVINRILTLVQGRIILNWIKRIINVMINSLRKIPTIINGEFLLSVADDILISLVDEEGNL